MCNVDQQESLFKVFQMESSSHRIDDFSCCRGHFFGPDDDATLNIALLHDRDELTHGLDTDVAFHRVENKESLVLVFGMLGEEVEFCTVDRATGGGIFGFERFKVDVDFVIGNLIATITDEFVNGLVDSPESDCFPIVFHFGGARLACDGDGGGGGGMRVRKCEARLV